ncbi:MAG: hypothetical protein V3S44_04045 [Alphaproteobacteria bacterium]
MTIRTDLDKTTRRGIRPITGALVFATALFAVSLAGGMTSPARAEQAGPPAQRSFVSVVRAYRIRYFDTYKIDKSDAGERLTSQRTARLCKQLGGPRFEGWSGHVLYVSRKGGKLTVQFEIAPRVVLKVASRGPAFGETKDTRVPMDSPLGKRLGKLHKGTKVLISGNFARIGRTADCLYETSVGMTDSFAEPHFLIELNDIVPRGGTR